VIKVPVSDGFFYQLANALRRVGMVRPLLQLYQVGTFPPHFHYYSKRSLRQLFDRAGLRVVEQWGDLDFEPDALLERLQFAAPLSGRLGRLASRLASALIRTGKRFDAQITILEVDRSRHPAAVRAARRASA
jgi:hypothetical protein